ncbi:MAG: chromate resistance protein [Chloroflexi bacterium]|nr:chromate resistance protein [Chloroflexota bacterium]
MKYVTRKHVKVDLVACPWLITRFVDPQAEFLFVEPGEVMAVAAREEAIPFDVAGVELGHQGANCSFDAVIAKYRIDAPGIDRLALIVRGADTDAKDLAPEARGLEAIAEGFRAVGTDDHDILRLEFPVYDALYAYCRARAGR